MKCITPMFREYIEYTPEEKLYMKQEDLKQWQKIIPRQKVMQMLMENPWKIRELEDLNQEWKDKGLQKRIQTIPCGHCWACRLNYSAEWATRCICEAEYSKETNFWITLTYDDEHLPIAEYIDYKKYQGKEYTIEREYNIGEEQWQEGTLYPEHVTKFLNSLRKHFERKGHTGIKYFYCGEYGSETHRPHYHIILFNCPLSIDEFYDFHVDKSFKSHWKSPEVEKYWPYGMIDITELEWSNAAYTARYSMKKLIDGSKTEEAYAQEGKIREFVRMSRRPGIGTRYYNEHKEKIYENDEMIMRTIKGNIGSIKPPKAWDRKFQEEHPEWYELLKMSRIQAMERAEALQREINNYTDYEILKNRGERVLEKGKMLIREL